MVIDFEELVALCDMELKHKEYRTDYYARMVEQWDILRQWMKKNGLSQFDEEIWKKYCDESFGTHLMPHRPPVAFREKLRAVRMLISYQKNGDSEFRCPSVEYVFEGDIGQVALKYLDHCKNELFLAEKTVENKRLYLYHFCRYRNINGFSYDDLSVEKAEDFLLLCIIPCLPDTMRHEMSNCSLDMHLMTDSQQKTVPYTFFLIIIRKTVSCLLHMRKMRSGRCSTLSNGHPLLGAGIIWSCFWQQSMAGALKISRSSRLTISTGTITSSVLTSIKQDSQ